MALVKLNVGSITSLPPIKLGQLLALDPDTLNKLVQMKVEITEHQNVLGNETTIVVSAMDPTGAKVHVDTKIASEKLMWATSDGYQLGKGAVQLAFVEAINKLWKLVYPGSSSPDLVSEKAVSAMEAMNIMLSKKKKAGWESIPLKDLLEPHESMYSMPPPEPLSIKEATDMINVSSVKTHTAPKLPLSQAVDTNLNNRVHLRHATELYQPVHGTDNESMYHVIALGDGLNAAGRIRTSHGVSLRMEGKFAKNEAFRQKAVAAGFSPSGDEHMSLHVQADSEQHAIMALGAMLASVPFSFSQSAPNLKAILYKGV